MKRNALLDQGWGFDYKGDERTVDTHIRRLREKIGERSIKTLADRDAMYGQDAVKARSALIYDGGKRIPFDMAPVAAKGNCP